MKSFLFDERMIWWHFAFNFVLILWRIRRLLEIILLNIQKLEFFKKKFRFFGFEVLFRVCSFHFIIMWFLLTVILLIGFFFLFNFFSYFDVFKLSLIILIKGNYLLDTLNKNSGLICVIFVVFGQHLDFSGELLLVVVTFEVLLGWFRVLYLVLQVNQRWIVVTFLHRGNFSSVGVQFMLRIVFFNQVRYRNWKA